MTHPATPASTPSVAYEVERGVAVLVVDHPPVNALSQAVRAGLLDGLRRAEADPVARAVVVICAGRTFVAGADIREFGQPPAEPLLPTVFAAFEAATKPVVAAIHGSALGGGFELALVCHARVAVESARVGLPEIRLGVIPGAGGTQRLPRLAGLDAALDMILSGAPRVAVEAMACGCLDRLVAEGDDLRAAALDVALAMAAQSPPPPPLRARAPDLPPAEIARRLSERRAAWIARDWDARDRIAQDWGARDWVAQQDGVAQDADGIAGLLALDAVEIGLLGGFDAGLAAERAAFLALRDSPRAAARREAFFAARKKPGAETKTS